VAAACLGQPAVRVITAGAGHEAIAAKLARTPGLRSDDVPDIGAFSLPLGRRLGRLLPIQFLDFVQAFPRR
jgi:hypothetical protein